MSLFYVSYVLFYYLFFIKCYSQIIFNAQYILLGYNGCVKLLFTLEHAQTVLHHATVYLNTDE